MEAYSAAATAVEKSQCANFTAPLPTSAPPDDTVSVERLAASAVFLAREGFCSDASKTLQRATAIPGVPLFPSLRYLREILLQLVIISFIGLSV